MPKIETYGGPQARTQVARGPRAQSLPDAAFGGQIGKALQGATDDVFKAQQAFMQRRDEVDAEAALVEYEREHNKLLFDPKEGYYSKQGLDAFDGADPTREALSKLRQQYTDKLQSSGARGLFERAATRMYSRSERQILGHAQKGFQAHESATRAAAIENTFENAALYWNSDEDLRVQRALGQAHKQDELDAAGIYGQARAESLQNYNSKFTKASILAALNAKNPAAARKLLETAQNGNHIEAPDVDDVTAKIRQIEVATQAETLTNRIFGDGNRDHGEVLDEARAIQDKEVRDIVVSDVTKLRRAYDLSQKRAQEATVDDLGKKITDPDNPMPLSQVTADPRWANLTHKNQQELRKLAAGKGKTSDLEYRDTLVQQITEMTPGEVAEVDLTEVRSKLEDKHYKPIEKMVLEARKGNFGPALEGSSLSKRLKWAMDDLNLSDKTEKGRAFVRQWDLEVARAQEQAEGGVLNDDDIKRIVRELNRRVVEPDGGWFKLDKSHRAFELREMPMVDFDEIPDDFKQGATDWLKGTERWTDDRTKDRNNIRMMYQQSLLQGSPAKDKELL